jgi:RIO-like serine/threonine protein kinase
MSTASRGESKSLPRHVQIADLKGQVFELQDKKCIKQQQMALINESLFMLGDQAPPLFDPMGEGINEDSVFMAGADGAEPPYASNNPKRKTTETFSRRLKDVFKKTAKKPAKETDVIDEEIRDMGDDGNISGDEEYDMPPEVNIEDEPWYFGVVDRRDAEKKCINDGDYLVRYSDRQNKYVLTVHWNGQGRHFVIQEVPDPQCPGNSLYRFEDKAFSVVRDLLDYHVTSRIPVTRNSGAIVCKFVSHIDKWTIKRQDITLGRKLGRGAFGEVCEAFMNTGEKVAVKTCRETIPAAEKSKFLKEAEILKQYDHPNIVRLIGVCAEKDPVYIIMELLPGGSLLDFLRKKGNHQPKKKLTSMVIDASAGMAYLESMNCIHRDLATRNCLVGEQDIVKISDFGMSREEECGIYQVSSGSRQIPIKWTAPEALNLGRYTSASDVWSFGILLWETFSLGSTPYPGMSNNEAREQVENGYRLPAPSNCPNEVYNVMLGCWAYDEDDRPNFHTIHQSLVAIKDTVHN